MLTGYKWDYKTKENRINQQGAVPWSFVCRGNWAQ